ncbi:zinc finger protein-domain-containing protein [Penicillium canariense]|uniref:Zinc finger protein-domain-containing protein n=1 Tax=Penicillium canariense TaxID=189055 RepID=A0A9W9LTR2_9EURO|nr:zinc finger protein-domain-containing protein [Penicillium canariense]KAJ5176241.1 zinc finger protein-domain-containing protein [Penicillium canariense]
MKQYAAVMGEIDEIDGNDMEIVPAPLFDNDFREFDIIKNIPGKLCTSILNFDLYQDKVHVYEGYPRSRKCISVERSIPASSR